MLIERRWKLTNTLGKYGVTLFTAKNNVTGFFFVTNFFVLFGTIFKYFQYTGNNSRHTV